MAWPRQALERLFKRLLVVGVFQSVSIRLSHYSIYNRPLHKEENPNPIRIGVSLEKHFVRIPIRYLPRLQAVHMEVNADAAN